MPHTLPFLQRGVIGHSVSHLLLACIPCHIPSAVLPTLGTSGTREFCVFANKWRQKQDQIEFITVDKQTSACRFIISLSPLRELEVWVPFISSEEGLSTPDENFSISHSCPRQWIRVSELLASPNSSTIHHSVFLFVFFPPDKELCPITYVPWRIFFFSSNTEPKFFVFFCFFFN